MSTRSRLLMIYIFRRAIYAVMICFEYERGRHLERIERHVNRGLSTFKRWQIWEARCA